MSKNMVNDEPLPAQNNTKPIVHMFQDHAVILIRQKNKVFLFDPSYGGKSDSFDIDKKNINAKMKALASVRRLMRKPGFFWIF